MDLRDKIASYEELSAQRMLKKWRDRIAARPAVKKAVEVLAERRRTTPGFSKEQAEVLFGATQYQKR